ncbi:MAG: hypothetical protein Q4C57_11465 [Bacillota bacterium]|nr:hypothetical protein [Bacillota bacterium]
MQKRLIVLLISIMLLTMTACGNKSLESANEAIAEQTDVEDEPKADLTEDNGESNEQEIITFSDGELRWKLPEQFEELEDEEGIYVHKSYPKDISTVSYIILENDSSFTDITKEEFQSMLEDDIYDTYGDEVDVIVNKYEKGKLNDRNTLRIDFEFQFKGTDYEQIEIIIFNGDETHIINYMQEKGGKWSEEFEKSISSMSFAQ